MPSLNPILSQMIAAGVLNPARWYLYFDETDYCEIEEKSFTGDFKVKIKIARVQNNEISRYRTMLAGRNVRFQTRGNASPDTLNFGFYSDFLIKFDAQINVKFNPFYDEITLQRVSNSIIITTSVDSEIRTYTNDELPTTFYFSRIGRDGVSGIGGGDGFYGYILSVNFNDEDFIKMDNHPFDYLLMKDSDNQVVENVPIANFQSGLWSRSLNA